MKLNNTRTVKSLIGIVALICLTNVIAFAQVQSWGNNDFGVLGLGNADHQPQPQTIPNSADITALNAGRLHTLALNADGTVMSWGDGQYGRLCNASETGRLSPGSVPNLMNVRAVAANFRNSLMLLEDGTLTVCGNNQFGQLGNGNAGNANENALVPQAVPGMSNVVAIAGAGNFFLALKSDGTVWAWGANEVGQLGIGTFSTAVGTPMQVSITGVVSISVGEFNGMALKSDRTIRVWGYNLNGQLGNGTINDSNPPCFCVPTPTQSSISNVVQVAAGVNYVTAVTIDGSVYSWGANSFGAFGNGTRGNQSALPVIATISNVVAIDTGQRHSIARKRDGSVWGWGNNAIFGQVGDGTTGGGTCNCKVLPVQSNVGTGNTIIAAAFEQGFAAKPNPTTPVGNNVQLRGENVNINFSSVTAAGSTTISQIDAAAVAGSYTLPFGTIQNDQPAYEISTTASTSGANLVCISGISAIDEAAFNGLSIMHGEGTTWVNRTYSRNFSLRQICAQVPSFSPFVIAQGAAPPTSAQVSVGGRVTNLNGYGVPRVTVTLTDGGGQSVMAITNAFGYYSFPSVEVGEVYIVQALSKRYEFSPPAHAISVMDAIENVNFTAISGSLRSKAGKITEQTYLPNK